ncbi:unnamed protein product [Aphanomyces euteiches]
MGEDHDAPLKDVPTARKRDDSAGSTAAPLAALCPSVPTGRKLEVSAGRTAEASHARPRTAKRQRSVVDSAGLMAAANAAEWKAANALLTNETAICVICINRVAPALALALAALAAVRAPPSASWASSSIADAFGFVPAYSPLELQLDDKSKPMSDDATLSMNVL